jgi:galactokinase
VERERVTHIAVFAPGRVNLIGEHTDYSGGLVLPVALDVGVTITARTGGNAIRLRSRELPALVELAGDGTSRGTVPAWGRYVSAVARLLDARGREPVGLEGEVTSTLPVGAGLSSSAAFDVAVALALCRAAALELAPLELARVAQEAERLAVGVPCGLMDPAASILGRAGHALFLDCGTEEYRLVALPPELAIVILDSGVRHRLEDSEYATRRAEVERALSAIGGQRPVELTVEQAAALARRAGIGETAARRLRHVVSENQRVRECVAALESGDPSLLATLGALFREGHLSLSRDFEVSIPELDLLVELAYEHGAAAARMTGGGFGGSIVALTELGRAPALATAVIDAYRRRTGRAGASFVCSSADGARDVV